MPARKAPPAPTIGGDDILSALVETASGTFYVVATADETVNEHNVFFQPSTADDPYEGAESVITGVSISRALEYLGRAEPVLQYTVDLHAEDGGEAEEPEPAPATAKTARKAPAQKPATAATRPATARKAAGATKTPAKRASSTRRK